jgi:hypothetical protein
VVLSNWRIPVRSDRELRLLDLMRPGRPRSLGTPSLK